MADRRVAEIMRDVLLDYEADRHAVLSPEDIVEMWNATPEGPKQVYAFIFGDTFPVVELIGSRIFKVGVLLLPMLSITLPIYLKAESAKQAALILLRTRYPEFKKDNPT